jgi:hypothetical protein
MTTRHAAAFLLIIPLSMGIAHAAAPPACASLCGDWRLDATASDAPERVLDAAFALFKDPRPKRLRNMSGNESLEALGRAADEEAMGPMLDRPRRKELREELQQALRQPRQLAIGTQAAAIRIASDGQSPYSLTPGENHARMDRYGTARVETRWHGAQLAISERYDRRNQQQTTYSVGRDGALQILQVITRPGLPRVTLRSVYRRP